MNFQINRWFGWVASPTCWKRCRRTPQITTYAIGGGSLWRLPSALRNGNVLERVVPAGRESFMRANDPERKGAREKFVEAVRSAYGLGQDECHAVPYADGRLRGFLLCLRVKPPRAKYTIVFFGGFDSYSFVSRWHFGRGTGAVIHRAASKGKVVPPSTMVVLMLRFSRSRWVTASCCHSSRI